MTTSIAALPQPAHAVPASPGRRKKRAPAHGPEYRGWQAFWALPVIIGLLLLAHAGRVVESVYLPISLLIAVYLCYKFPRIYVAYVLLATAISPLVNRIAASQSVLLPKSPVLAAPFLVVAVSAFRMWRGRPPGYRALTFTLPLLAIFYGVGIGVFTIGVRAVIIPAAGWLCPLFFGFYCYANEDTKHSLAEMYLRSISVAGLFIAVYGLMQYWSPFQWDIDWLQRMQEQGMALSMGQPEPYGIRIFSTVSNSAGAAVFLASAFLAISTVEARWRIPAMACTVVTLILTSVRAAWMALAIAAFLLLLRASNKARVQAVAGLVVLVFAMITAGQTAQGDKILERFNTFGQLKKDHSLRDRETDINEALSMAGNKPFGGGVGYTTHGRDVRFSAADVGGVSIPIELGWFGTLLYAAGLVIAIVTIQYPAIRRGGRFMGLAMMSLLPLLLLSDENLLETYAGLLFTAPTALLMHAVVFRQKAHHEQPPSKRRIAAQKEALAAGGIPLLSPPGQGRKAELLP